MSGVRITSVFEPAPPPLSPLEELVKHVDFDVQVSFEAQCERVREHLRPITKRDGEVEEVEAATVSEEVDLSTLLAGSHQVGSRPRLSPSRTWAV